MAAPSWAANGNSANAQLCEPGGYPGVLFNQLGAFKNSGVCTKYAAKGGRLAGASAVGEPPSGGRFNESCSGFGLLPGNGGALCGAGWEEGGSVSEEYAGNGTVAADGTWSSTSGNLPCEKEAFLGHKTKVSFLVVSADFPIGGGHYVEVLLRFPPPSGC
jgi:hypothetical protein